MNKYIPDEVKDLTNSKQRVMRNVVSHLENKNQKKPGRGWQVGIMTAILAAATLFFIVNQFTAPNNEQATNGNEKTTTGNEQPTTGNELQSFFEVTVEDQFEMTEGSHSGWKTSPNGLQRATIHGKGEFAFEEGIASLVLESHHANATQIFQLKQDSESQNTPKFVEWIDDNRLFVIVGFAYGTVTQGGQLYVMDLEDNTIVPVFENLPNKEEIMSIEANEDGTFTYQKHIYIDDNYSEGYVEEGVLPFPNKKEDVGLTNIENTEIKEITKTEDEETPPLFAMKDRKIYVNGLTFLDSPSDAVALWDEPEKSGFDGELLYGDTYQDFQSLRMFITYYEEELMTMTLHVDEKALKIITENFEGEHYIDRDSGSEFFYVPYNNHLLIYRTNNNAEGTPELLLIPGDGNFQYYVDNGVYEKVN